MASSQIEIASSSPFGCVLRDRNQRDRCRENNARAAFQKNLKNLVRDHFSTCISISSSPAENCQHQINSQDCWVGQEQGRIDHHQNLQFMRNNNNINDDNNNGDESLGMSPRQSRLLDRWAARQAREMVSTIERQTHEAEIQALSNSQAVSTRASSFLRESSPAQSDTSVEMPNVGASSLVQMWEERLNGTNSLNLNSAVGNGSRTNSGLSYGDNASSPVEEPSRGFENGDFGDDRDESQTANEDSFGDWESDRTAASELSSSLQGRDSNAGESERIRVSDMVKRLTIVNGRPRFLTSCSNDNEHELPSTSRASCSVSNQSQPRGSSQNVSSPLMREPERSSVLNQAVAEKRSSSQFVNSPRVRERSYALDQTEQRVAFEQNLSLLPRIRARCSALDQAEQRNFLPVGRSPRIRGRQAFNDLLMHMERDRHRELGDLVERRAVSRFQQRGRIQSMLRLRFLQRGVAIQEQQPLHSTPSSLNRPQLPTTPHPRETFNTSVEHGALATRSEEADSSTPHLEILNNTQDLESSSTTSQISEDSDHQEIDTHGQDQRAASVRSSETYGSEVFHEEGSPSSDVTWLEASFEASNLDRQETEEISWDGNVTADEQESDNQQLIGTNYDWLRDISRPRIHWEGRRQAWYQEMLDSDSDKEEIRQLLERRRVSTFLASDFRHRIDQLMVSRLNQQTQQSGSQEEAQDEVGSQERMGQLMMSFFRRHTQVGSQEEVEGEGAEEEVNEEDEEVDEEDEEEKEEEEEEEESSIGHQYHEVSNYFDQTPSSVNLPLPSPISSWSSYQDQEVGNDTDQVASTSLRQPLPSQSYYHETRQGSSSMNRPSLEMELIYDLRGHMEQLHQEMSELRKSLKSCMDMQVQLQHSFKQEDHSVQGVGKKSLNRAPRKGSCCICYEMPVDSLLYRCGHMCTCLKCAHELQWSSGKCPICRAPIIDVVRAFADS